jgi:hypothetical protein
MFGVPESSIFVLQLAFGFGSAIVLVVLAILDLREAARLGNARAARRTGGAVATETVSGSAAAANRHPNEQPLAA